MVANAAATMSATSKTSGGRSSLAGNAYKPGNAANMKSTTGRSKFVNQPGAKQINGTHLQ